MKFSEIEYFELRNEFVKKTDTGDELDKDEIDIRMPMLISVWSSDHLAI
jgi:hypothetical protein